MFAKYCYLILVMQIKTMKLKQICLTLTAIATFYLSACKKETSDPQPQVTITADSNYLSKIYYIDSTANTSDTFITRSFSYDNLKRVTNQLYYTSNQGYTSSIQYSYSSNDTLPVKSIAYLSAPTGKDTLYGFYFYNLSGKKTKDSIIHKSTGIFNRYTEVCNYSYSTNKITGTSISYVNGSPNESYKDTAALDANGNIVLLKEYRFNLSTNTSDLLFVINTTLDNKPSPFTKLTSTYAEQIFPAGNDPAEFIAYPQQNNFTSNIVNHYNNGIVSFTETFDIQYKYNTNGLIKEERYPDGIEQKAIYIYTAL
jgi:hypothetical protein